MNDFYISSAPSVDQAAQAAQLIADILERAAAPGDAGACCCSWEKDG
jgi:hypothetical protein